jgi:ribosomal protein S27AE
MTYDIGEKPGKGEYKCTNCSWQVTLDDDDDRLPPCGNCGKGQDTTYIKVG